MAKYLALDVGEKRVGVALADDNVKIAVPYDTLQVDGTELESIAKLSELEKADVIVVGYPRNQSGEPTQQTQFTEEFIAKLPIELAGKVVYQDESVTSIQAEQHLKSQKQPYTKEDIDKVAASIILQDYLEAHGRI
jgi:putative Holliday junction resolvase